MLKNHKKTKELWGIDLETSVIIIAIQILDRTISCVQSQYKTKFPPL